MHEGADGWQVRIGDLEQMCLLEKATGGGCGTRGYMAPERMMGATHFTRAQEMFSFG